MDLPPGFRFHPTDEEIIIHYLVKKVLDRRFSSRAIEEADFNKCEPWDLTKKEKMGEKEWFFCKKDRKYPTGMRTNRATESGYWKATGKDREIYKGKNCLVGMKKTLVFYTGRAPKGEKTNWVMHEYRLEPSYYSDNPPKTPKIFSHSSANLHTRTIVRHQDLRGKRVRRSLVLQPSSQLPVLEQYTLGVGETSKPRFEQSLGWDFECKKSVHWNNRRRRIYSARVLIDSGNKSIRYRIGSSFLMGYGSFLVKTISKITFLI